MFTLKLVETLNKTISGSMVKEKESYHEVGVDCEVLFLRDAPDGEIAKVVASDTEIVIYPNQSAYLVNEHGKTLKVINRVTIE